MHESGNITLKTTLFNMSHAINHNFVFYFVDNELLVTEYKLPPIFGLSLCNISNKKIILLHYSEM